MTASTLAASPTGSALNMAEKIVVVGDIHGAHTAFVELLQATDLVDSAQNWSGGNTHFVSLGDILDRGAESRKSMDLLMKLQTQAQQAGGQVHVVAGNHELMNIMGDLRYVSAGEYAAFAKDETQAMRDAAFQSLQVKTGISPTNFNIKYPNGYFAHRAAFALTGKYGQWLISLPAITVVNDTAFVHGGLPEIVAVSSLAKTNQSYRSELSEYMDLRQAVKSENLLPDDDMQDLNELAQGQLENPVLEASQKRRLRDFIALEDGEFLGTRGPVWYRGAMMCRPVFEKPILDASLTKLGAKRVVVGHTPSSDGQVHTRFGGKLIQLDTGMLVSHYKGRPSALVIKGADINVRYLNPTQTAGLSADRASPAVQADPEAERAIQQGSLQTIAQGIRGEPARVRITHLGKPYEGRFYTDAKEAAAYQLDQLLGFDVIPPTYVRTHDSKTGSLQIAYLNGVSDSARQKENTTIGGWCPIPRQYQLMYVFDLLTANPARTSDTLFFKKGRGLIYLTGFDEAFGSFPKLPVGARRASIQLTPEMRKALAGLTASALSAHLQGLLSDKEIAALLARRDAILVTY